MALAETRSKVLRVPFQRIAGWRPINPTVYSYGYIWAAQSSYFFWRDQGIAQSVSDEGIQKAIDRLSPCYLNRINPVEVSFGYGDDLLVKIQKHIVTWSKDKTFLPFNSTLLTDCLAPPAKGFNFPDDL